jgi:hypothetical protein
MLLVRAIVVFVSRIPTLWIRWQAGREFGYLTCISGTYIQRLLHFELLERYVIICWHNARESSLNAPKVVFKSSLRHGTNLEMSDKDSLCVECVISAGWQRASATSSWDSTQKR